MISFSSDGDKLFLVAGKEALAPTALRGMWSRHRLGGVAAV